MYDVIPKGAKVNLMRATISFPSVCKISSIILKSNTEMVEYQPKFMMEYTE